MNTKTLNIWGGVDSEGKAQVVTTIANQIGRSAMAMMGATFTNYSETSLSMKIGRNAKAVTHITITLDRGTDSYSVDFFSVRAGRVKTLSRHTQVYADMLHALIELNTGLYLSM